MKRPNDKTFAGGLISLVFFAAVIVWATWDIQEIRQMDEKLNYTVVNHAGLQATLTVEFKALPCSFIAAFLLDQDGTESWQTVKGSVQKKTIGDATSWSPNLLGSTFGSYLEGLTIEHDSADSVCFTCFGAPNMECCNSCEEAKLAGKAVGQLGPYPQCAYEDHLLSFSGSNTGGCAIDLTFETHLPVFTIRLKVFNWGQATSFPGARQVNIAHVIKDLIINYKGVDARSSSLTKPIEYDNADESHHVIHTVADPVVFEEDTETYWKGLLNVNSHLVPEQMFQNRPAQFIDIRVETTDIKVVVKQRSTKILPWTIISFILRIAEDLGQAYIWLLVSRAVYSNAAKVSSNTNTGKYK